MDSTKLLQRVVLRIVIQNVTRSPCKIYLIEPILTEDTGLLNHFPVSLLSGLPWTANSAIFVLKSNILLLTLSVPIPQNGQKYLTNLLTTAGKSFRCV